MKSNKNLQKLTEIDLQVITYQVRPNTGLISLPHTSLKGGCPLSKVKKVGNIILR